MNRSRDALRPRTWLLAVTAVIVAGLPACTTTPIRIPERPKARPPGRILGVVAGTQRGLIEYAFSSGRRRVFTTPDPAQSAFFWGNPPSEYAFLLGTTGRIRLFTVMNGGTVRPISSSRRTEVQPSGLPAGDLLVAASCQGREPVFVLNLRAVDPPREVARGCPAALSPSGASVAFAPDLVSVWRIPSDGTGQSEPIVRLSGRRLLLQLGMRSPRILSRAGMSWGRAGLAVAVEGGGRFACVLVEPSGKVRVIPLGAARPSALAWDPTGRLLAFTENDRTGVALRVFDAVTHRLRLAALALGKGLRGLVWSPKSDALITHWKEPITGWWLPLRVARCDRSPFPRGPSPTDWTA